MTEQTPEEVVPEQPGPEASTETSPPARQPQTLEELLADLDDDKRTVILGQVTKARSEAKNLRTRIRELEPKAAQLDQLEQISKSEADRARDALNQANQRMQQMMERTAAAEIKASLAGVVDDPDAIVEDLNLRRFMDDDGEVDQDAVRALRAKFAAFGGRRAPRPDSSQASGANGGSPATPQEQFASFLKQQLNAR